MSVTDKIDKIAANADWDGVDRLVAALRAVLDLAEWHETKADKARRFPGGDPVVMSKAAAVHDDAASRLRRAIEEALS